MSQDVCQSDLEAKSQQLLQGPLEAMYRAAALAAALLPLALSGRYQRAGAGLRVGRRIRHRQLRVARHQRERAAGDGCDSGIDGVRLWLKDGSGSVVATVTTGPNGAYVFRVCGALIA